MAGCMLCPRRCGAARDKDEVGFCGVDDTVRVVLSALHHFEEPPISGTRGAGTVFFAGCSLRCCFCQNAAISHTAVGRAVREEELGDMMLSLQDKGAHNIDLVTPTHYTDVLVRVLKRIKPRLHVPVVWNSSGYERVETLRGLEGLVDIYLPDFKYMDRTLSRTLSGAADYAEVATAALLEMHRQVGAPVFDGEGLMRRGLMVRHLVLPGYRRDSAAVLRHLAEILPRQGAYLSLMRQYTPEFASPTAPKSLHRKLTTFEYQSVQDLALELGFLGFSQGADAAGTSFTPDFGCGEG